MISLMCMKTVVRFMILYSFLISYGTKGIQFSQEELQWDKQYQLLKKPSVKAIKTKYGDIYDCVDFYKQPAFDNPLLKNHSSHPQVRPSLVPEWLKAETSIKEDDEVFLETKLKDGGCPVGTVPVRRLSKDEFIQIKRFTKDYASKSKLRNTIQRQPGTYLAIVQTDSDQSKVNYYGVRCILNVYGPKVTPPQYSAAEMIVQNGDDRIQVGWMVNPTLHNDNHTHLFQYLNAGQSHCFNLLCPGFVGVNRGFPIDLAMDIVSTRGGAQWAIGPFVYQDPKTGHWWLLVKDRVRPDNIIGYWPREIFTGLVSSATYIATGGEAYSPPHQPLPAMGNGYYPTEDLFKSAYCANFEVLDVNRQKINPQQTKRFTNDWHYGVYDRKHIASYGRTIFFGGTTLEI